ncbi:hypothetical protein LC612_28520 [Nostoc sp. CHAB 5834]|nr:hypothetical protein [Nostoc sp. CHAB 5834]
MTQDIVNTSAVKALMHLRGVSNAMMANFINCTLSRFEAWLYEYGENSDSMVGHREQLEVLRILGVEGDTLRPDVVHYWRVYEGLFSRPSNTYWALSIVLKTFGKAEMAHLTLEKDPGFSLKAVTHFALRFPEFAAVLEVTAHPLKSCSLDPSLMPELSWVHGEPLIFVQEESFASFEPGFFAAKELQQQLSFSAESGEWERLREAAFQKGVNVARLAIALGDFSTEKSVPTIGSVPSQPGHPRKHSHQRNRGYSDERASQSERTFTPQHRVKNLERVA